MSEMKQISTDFAVLLQEAKEVFPCIEGQLKPAYEKGWGITEVSLTRAGLNEEGVTTVQRLYFLPNADHFFEYANNLNLEMIGQVNERVCVWYEQQFVVMN